MPDYVIDLLSWVVAFVVLGVVWRWLQTRKANRKDDE